MGDAQVLLSARVGAVARLTLNRPSKMNAINGAMLNALESALAEIEADETVRVVAITGAGPAFCAGADLKEALAGLDQAGPVPDFLERSAAIFSTLRELNKPVIAAVNGLAMAGGLELVLCADIVLAAESARFGDGHANYGVFPGAGGAALLPRALPPAVARYLLFTGDTLSAEEMRRHGLVTAVHPDTELDAAAMALAARIAAGPRVALGYMKRNMNAAESASLKELLDLEAWHHTRTGFTEDHREAAKAFVDKRQPVFRGR